MDSPINDAESEEEYFGGKPVKLRKTQSLTAGAEESQKIEKSQKLIGALKHISLEDSDDEDTSMVHEDPEGFSGPADP